MIRRVSALGAALAAAALLSACGTGAAEAMDDDKQPMALASVPADVDPNAPQVAVTEKNTGNDDAKAKIPQGISVAAAQAQGMGTDGRPVITVVGTDTSCRPDRAATTPGKVWFTFQNNGTKESEFYLLNAEAEELIEVEHIAPGGTGAFSFVVNPAEFMIACEPGMADIQYRAKLTITN